MINGRMVFLREFLRHPREIGSVTPSSRSLERHIVELAQVRSARAILELGGGTGGTTRAILAAMPANAKLLTIEINPLFCDVLRRIDDHRLVVHRGDAHELSEAAARHGVSSPDVVISGIPFSTIDRIAGSEIVTSIASMLVPGGRFVAYQVSKQVHELMRPLLGPAHVEVELLNIPPLRLFRWRKSTAESAVAAERREVSVGFP
jgi:phospholipid N-methyltransferase